MNWHRNSSLNKPTRITITLYPGQDDDIYSFIASIPYGNTSVTIKKAIRNTMQNPQKQTSKTQNT